MVYTIRLQNYRSINFEFVAVNYFFHSVIHFSVYLKKSLFEKETLLRPSVYILKYILKTFNIELNSSRINFGESEGGGGEGGLILNTIYG